MAETQNNLDFYRALRSYDFRDSSARDALAFARIFTDISQRISAALCAQRGIPVEFPVAVTLPAFVACLEGGSDGVAQHFAGHIHPHWTAEQALLLPGLAEWLASGFDAADPLGTSYQVWVGRPGQQEVQLWGPSRPRDVPQPLRLLSELPIEQELQARSGSPAAVLSHYDVHGLAAISMCLRQLAALGYGEIDSAMSYEWTGEIGKLWKRAVPRTIQHESDYGFIFLLDCSVHSRDPQRTLRAIAKLDEKPDTRLVMIDHHYDTFLLAPQMQHPRFNLVLSDVLSCSLVRRYDEATRTLAVLGALGDKVPEVAVAVPQGENAALYAAVEEYNGRCMYFSPTPPEMKQRGDYPLAPLWNALAEGAAPTPELAQRTLGELTQEAEPELPECMSSGGLIFVTQRLELRGRLWYGLLERLMEREGQSYAVAIRMLNGRRVNLLLLTRWIHTHMPPVRYFIPPQYLSQCLGHPGALWADLEPGQALPFLREVARGINRFLEQESPLEAVFARLEENILSVEAVYDQPESR